MIKEGMILGELKTKKVEMEKVISEAITKFRAETGFNVEKLWIGYAPGNIGHPSLPVFSVKAEVHI